LNTLAAEKPKSAEKENYFQLELLRRIYQFLQCGEYVNAGVKTHHSPEQ